MRHLISPYEALEIFMIGSLFFLIFFFVFLLKTSLWQFFMSSCQETTSPLFTNEVLTASVQWMHQCCCDVMLMAVLCPVQMRHTSSWLGRLWRNLTGVWTSWRPFRPTALLARWLPTRCFFNHYLLKDQLVCGLSHFFPFQVSIHGL